MERSLEFLLGLIERESPARVGQEDFAGDHAAALRLWQRLSFLSRTAEPHPVPSCPRCREGVPFSVGGRLRCMNCLSPIESGHLHLWRFDFDAFLAWLARSLELRGGVEQLDEHLWQLGSFRSGGTQTACFFLRSGPCSDRGQKRLLAYRNALLLTALPDAEPVSGYRGHHLTLLEILREERGQLRVTDLAQLLQAGGAVRFDAAAGVLFAGDKWLGEVPLGSKEYHLLACLGEHLDAYVPYADLKHEVLRRSGSSEETEEANFCHKLKARIKKRGWIPQIDNLIATTNKGDGFRLRGHLGEGVPEGRK